MNSQSRALVNDQFPIPRAELEEPLRFTRGLVLGLIGSVVFWLLVATAALVLYRAA